MTKYYNFVEEPAGIFCSQDGVRGTVHGLTAGLSVTKEDRVVMGGELYVITGDVWRGKFNPSWWYAKGYRLPWCP